ncbi:branched-chain amino acid transport system permease protein [Nocardioides terrae]|uniref:Branched-chain amino acid transport system permease protein n=1 Tax=Nocardioides terrae TaxID=574651 RepID=A0A1I1H3P4_9ACTN|nr:branched-chain amino acid ABC transporter permease [Nocardioides terrae]SFC18554.1 branched-chain amino acid transport system permease protein [Nocardioides terrae]
MSLATGLLSRAWVRWAITAVVVVVLFVLPLQLDEYTNQNLARIGVFAVAVLGLNVVMGYTGQVSLGQIFFVGAGAYVTGYGASHDWNIVLVFVASVLVPGVIGLLVALAAARLGGLAIAMVTIALPIVGVPFAKRLSDFTGGSQGMSSAFSNAPGWTGLYNDQWQLYIVLVVGGAVFLLIRNLVRGKYGRAFAIVKDNEAVAASMGISPYRYKVLAFTVASLIGGASGFLYMAVIQFTSPETMSFGHSITLLASMVIGGAASILGSLLGGAYYVLVPQWSNDIDPNLTELLQGALLLLTLLLLPGGLATLPRVLARTLRRTRTPDPSERRQTPSAPPAPGRASVEETPTVGGIPAQSPTERQEQA